MKHQPGLMCKQINSRFKYPWCTGRIKVNDKYVGISNFTAFHYTGQVNLKNQYHGIGRLQRNASYLYEGEFKNGKFDGFGRIIYFDGSYYQGQFEEGQYNGNG